MEGYGASGVDISFKERRRALQLVDGSELRRLARLVWQRLARPTYSILCKVNPHLAEL